MNADVYTFTCLLRDYDEDFASLSPQDQYDAAPKFFKQFLNSSHSKNRTDTTLAILDYLDEKYRSDDFEFDAEEDY
jgi:hypothetical protein